MSGFKLIYYFQKTHGMEVYHKIVKVNEDQLDQLGVEPLETFSGQAKEEQMELSSDEESIPASEPEETRNRAESLNPEQYRDFKNLTRQDTVVPDQVFEDRIADGTAPQERVLHDLRFYINKERGKNGDD